MASPTVPTLFARRKAVAKLAPTIASDVAWAEFVLDAAKGLSPSGLATKYGLTLMKVERLLRAPEVQEQVKACAHRIAKVGDYAINHLLSRAPDLIEAQLDVALGTEPCFGDDGVALVGEDGEPQWRWKYDVKERMTAGRYCLDKILPTITKQVHEPSTMGVELVTSLRDHLAELTRTSLPSRPSVLDSPHVFEGEKALPKAIEAEIVGRD